MAGKIWLCLPCMGYVMKANVGGIDRLLRIVVGTVLLASGIAGIGVPWTFIGLVPLFTGLAGWCALYPILGVNSCPKND